MALMNRKLEPAVETIFLMPKQDYSYVSSSNVRTVASLGGDISQFVPPPVQRALEVFSQGSLALSRHVQQIASATIRDRNLLEARLETMTEVSHDSHIR